MLTPFPFFLGQSIVLLTNTSSCLLEGLGLVGLGLFDGQEPKESNHADNDRTAENDLFDHESGSKDRESNN